MADYVILELEEETRLGWICGEQAITKAVMDGAAFMPDTVSSRTSRRCVGTIDSILELHFTFRMEAVSS
jgi:hypothetical protein